MAKTRKRRLANGMLYMIQLSMSLADECIQFSENAESDTSGPRKKKLSPKLRYLEGDHEDEEEDLGHMESEFVTSRTLEHARGLLGPRGFLKTLKRPNAVEEVSNVSSFSKIVQRGTSSLSEHLQERIQAAYVQSQRTSLDE